MDLYQDKGQLLLGVVIGFIIALIFMHFLDSKETDKDTFTTTTSPTDANAAIVNAGKQLMAVYDNDNAKNNPCLSFTSIPDLNICKGTLLFDLIEQLFDYKLHYRRHQPQFLPMMNAYISQAQSDPNLSEDMKLQVLNGLKKFTRREMIPMMTQKEALASSGYMIANTTPIYTPSNPTPDQLKAALTASEMLSPYLN